jgi:drug/metabolite transporter (DMT)-like permease
MKEKKLVMTKIDSKDHYKSGIFSMIISSLCLVLMSVMIKQLRHLPLMEIMFFQNIPSMIIIPLILKRMNLSIFGNNKCLLYFNGFISMSAQLTKYYTFTVMLLADATTIHRLSPFFVFFLSGIFLKEKLSFQRIPLFFLAFLGGLLVIKPGFRVEMFPAMIALIAAILISVSHINMRYLRLTNHYLVITNALAYISGLGSLIILLLQKSFQTPNPAELLTLILIGFAALVAWIMMTRAYQLVQASLISLYTYSQIIFASLFGLLFFKEIPDFLTIMGASLIILSGYFNYRLKAEE